MTRIIIRVSLKEESKITGIVKKIFFSGIEGILPPKDIAVAAVIKSSSDPTSQVVVPAPHNPQSEVVERRIAVEYSSEHFPLLTLLDPENEMVPEPAEREELALHLLDTMVAAHSIGLYHGQLNSERIYIHSDDPICYLTDFYIGKSYNPYICPRDYRGPESILRCEADSAEKVDVWAMGCLLFELLSTEALFTLPSSKDEVGVTAPTLLKKQIMAIVARVASFTTSEEEKGVGKFPENITNLFEQYKNDDNKHQFVDAETSLKMSTRDHLANGTISGPFVWAIQQCLTFSPFARPSLKAIRDGLMERMGYSAEDIAAKNYSLASHASRLAKVQELLDPSPVSGENGSGSEGDETSNEMSLSRAGSSITEAAEPTNEGKVEGEKRDPSNKQKDDRKRRKHDNLSSLERIIKLIKDAQSAGKEISSFPPGSSLVETTQ